MALPPELLSPELLSPELLSLPASLLGAPELLTVPDPAAPEGSLFGLSLLPYLAFLYFLGYGGNRTPPMALFGFKFLLAFVFGSIPAAIASGVLFNVTLADCDWAHGTAESLLAVTNLLIVLGFRSALRGSPPPAEPPPAAAAAAAAETRLGSSPAALALPALVLLGLAGAPLGGDFLGLAVHSRFLGGLGDLPPDLAGAWASALGSAEPLNALSVPTWLIHISSLVEWLAAMGLVWRYSAATQCEEWKGVTWGMLPLHTSGICACTYHLFYNAPALAFLVPLQALLTLVGNSTAAYAAYRLARANGWSGRQLLSELPPALASQLPAAAAAALEADAPTAAPARDGAGAGAGAGAEGGAGLIGFEDLADAWSADGNAVFVAKLIGGCGLASYVVKYGELAAHPPFEHPEALALAVIVLPTLLNGLKWRRRSEDEWFDGWF